LKATEAGLKAGRKGNEMAKRYTVELIMEGSSRVTVEASSEDEAIDMARERFIKHNSLRSFCHGEIYDVEEIETEG